jgi:hypothetical protein
MLERSGVAIGEWAEKASPVLDMLRIDMACARAKDEIEQWLA